MTAEQAFNITINRAAVAEKKWYQAIDKEIYRAALRGEYHINVFDVSCNNRVQKLKEKYETKGYLVSYISTEYSNYVSIDWRKS